METRQLVVVDASFLVDLYDESQPRHAAALQVAKMIPKLGFHPAAPYHSMFEVSCTLRRNMADKKFVGCAAANDFGYEGIPIDKAFVTEFFDQNLPILKAGDTLYLAVAKKRNGILLTDDVKLGNAAKECGVDILTPQQFVERYR